MKVKVKDIAAAAGVSPSTVSLVLNNRPSRISEETRELILRTAREVRLKSECGFESGALKRVKTIGLVIPDGENLFFREMAEEASRSAALHGYVMFQCLVDNDVQNFYQALEGLAAKNVDGLIAVPPCTMNKENSGLLRSLQKSGVPMVLLDRAAYNVFCDFVTADNKMGGRLATEYLIRNGHRRIGCVMGDKHVYTSRARINGYCEALALHQIPFEEKWVYYGGFHAEGGKKGAEILFSEGVTAIVAGNDRIAYGIYLYAAGHGISIPEDLSVVGYDDTMICRFLNPPLTSINQNSGMMADKAVELLLSQIEERGEYVEIPQNFYFTPTLKERESVKRINENSD